MKKESKNGFTLLEMVLVIAIICIVTMVIWYSVSMYLNAAKTATEKVETHNSVVESVREEVLEENG